MPAPGKKQITPDDLDLLVKDYQVRLAHISSMAKRLRRDGVESFEAQGMKGARGGIEALEKFITNCERHIGRF